MTDQIKMTAGRIAAERIADQMVSLERTRCITVEEMAKIIDETIVIHSFVMGRTPLRLAVQS